MIRRILYRYLVLFLLTLFVVTGLTPVLAQVHSQDPKQLVEYAESDYRAGNFISAVNYLQQAINIFESRQDWRNLGITLTNLGRVELNLGQAESALERWQKAGQIFEDRLNDIPAKVRTEIYTAEALQQLGFNSRACANLRSVLTLNTDSCQDITVEVIEEKYQNPNALQIMAWRSLANVMRSIGRLEESMLILEKLALTSDDPNSAATRLSLGNTLRSRGDLIRDRQAFPRYDYQPWSCAIAEEISTEAREVYQQAEKQYRDVITLSPSKNTKIAAQINLLNLLLETARNDTKGTLRNRQQYETIINQLSSEILDVNSPINKLNIYAKINLIKSQICLSGINNQPPKWREINKELQEVYQSSKSIANQNLESYALGNLGRFYEYRAQWLERNPGDNNTVVCYGAGQCRQQAIDYTSSALLLAQPSQSPQIAYQWQWQLGRLWKAAGDKEKAIAMYEGASKSLESVRKDLLTIDPDVQFSFRDSVEPLYREYVDLLLSTDNLSQVNREIFPAQALNVIDFLRLSELENFLQCSLAPEVQLETVVGEIDSQAAFIYPLVLGERLEVIFKLPGQPLAHRATPIPHREVEETIKHLQDYLRQARLTEEVKLGAGKVYEWIIKPIEGELEASRQQGKLKTLVFVLDDSLRNIPMSVLYDGGEYLIQKYAIALIPNRILFDARPRQKQIKVLTAGVSDGQTVDGITFEPLPYVPSELEDIQKLADSFTQPLLNQVFTSGLLEQKIDSANFGIVHIATHGEFSSNPDETYLLLWGKRIKVREFDRILRINSPDNYAGIDLLILSACETAQGNRRAALGLAGVAAQARVRTTIASLWHVNDRATAEFMTRFYQELRDGATIAEAIRKTQLYFIEDVDRRRPYFWAPFVIVGNWL